MLFNDTRVLSIPDVRKHLHSRMQTMGLRSYHMPTSKIEVVDRKARTYLCINPSRLLPFVVKYNILIVDIHVIKLSNI